MYHRSKKTTAGPTVEIITLRMSFMPAWRMIPRKEPVMKKKISVTISDKPNLTNSGATWGPARKWLLSISFMKKAKTKSTMSAMSTAHWETVEWRYLFTRTNASFLKSLFIFRILWSRIASLFHAQGVAV